jgi:hypothetical protein
MKKFLSRVLTAVVLIGVAVYGLERYVLQGHLIASSSIRPSDMNPHPALALDVEEDTNVTAYLKSELGADYTLRILAPDNSVMQEETVSGSHHRVTFHADAAGTYHLEISLPNPPGKVVMVKAYANDHRIIYPLIAQFL